MLPASFGTTCTPKQSSTMGLHSVHWELRICADGSHVKTDARRKTTYRCAPALTQPPG